MKGYKGFDWHMNCAPNGSIPFHYKVGQTYFHKGNIEMCKRGFHFCGCLTDVFYYYPVAAGTRICEVEADERYCVRCGGDGKCVCRKITIVRELSKDEILRQLNAEKIGMRAHGTPIDRGGLIKALEGKYREAADRRRRRYAAGGVLV